MKAKATRYPEVNETFQVDTKQKSHWEKKKTTTQNQYPAKMNLLYSAVIDARPEKWIIFYILLCSTLNVNYTRIPICRTLKHELNFALMSGDIKVNGLLFTWLKLSVFLSFFYNKYLLWRRLAEIQSRNFPRRP